MLKRFTMVLLTLILALISIFVAAKYPTGPNTVTFEEPFEVMITIGMIVVLFMPPLFLAFFNNIAVKVISSIYQSFIALSFIVMIPIGFMAASSFWVSVVGAVGAIVSIYSIIVTIFVGLQNRSPVT